MEEFQNIHITFTRQLQLIQQDNSIEVIQQNANGEALTLEDWKTILQIVAKRKKRCSIRKVVITQGLNDDDIPANAGTRTQQQRDQQRYQVGNDIKKLLQKNDCIECLSMRHMHLGDNGAEAVGLGLARMRHSSNLKVLKLCNAAIGDKGARLLKQGLCRGKSPLCELSLAGNDIGDIGAIEIASLLISHCGDKDKDKDKDKDNKEDKNPAILKLNLSRNKIRANGTNAIANGLHRNKTLLELNLDQNELGDEGAHELSKAVSVHQQLIRLHLNGCAMRKSGIASIANALRTNKSLLHLDIQNNNTANDNTNTNTNTNTNANENAAVEIDSLLLDALRHNFSLVSVSCHPFDFPNLPSVVQMELELRLEGNKRGVPFVHIEVGKLPPKFYPHALVGISHRWGISTLFDVVKGQVGSLGG